MTPPDHDASEDDTVLEPFVRLPPEDHDERIQSHEARVEGELAALSTEVAKHVPPPRTTPQSMPKGSLPGHRTWGSIRLVNCHRCCRTLLGTCDEHLRKRASKLAMLRLSPPVGKVSQVVVLRGRSPELHTVFICTDCA